MVTVSVIIPVYNVEKYLEETLNCLLHQDFEDAEFILVNDGSKDSSPDICRKFEAMDSRFIVIDQPNGGPAKARNTGIDYASGEYICFIDADDLLSDNALNEMYEKVQGFDILVHGTDFIGDYDEVPAWIANASDIKRADYNDFSIGKIFSVNGCGPVLWLHFIKSSLIKDNNLHIDEKLFVGEDFSFAVNYFSYAKKVRFVPDKYYSYRLFRQGSLMTTYQKKPKEKLEQSLLMSRVIYNTIKDRMKNDDEAPIINAIIVFNFRDLYRLECEDMAEYASILVRYLDVLHIESHIHILSGITIMMYGYARGIIDKTVRITSDVKDRITKDYWNLFMS